MLTVTQSSLAGNGAGPGGGGAADADEQDEGDDAQNGPTHTAAAAPLALGLLWTRQTGYAHGLWLMLGLSVVAITALVMAQRLSAKN